MNKKRAIELYGNDIEAVHYREPHLIICRVIQYDEDGRLLKKILLLDKTVDKYSYVNYSRFYSFVTKGKKYNFISDFISRATAEEVELI